MESDGYVWFEAKAQQRTCSADGCDAKHDSHGYCQKHAARLRRYGRLDIQRRQNGTGGYNKYGYKVITRKGHPLANSVGRVYEHRALLYDLLGGGAHPCAWCGKELNWFSGIKGPQPENAIIVDHVDFNPHNNELSNLVVACAVCNNTREGANGAKRTKK